LNAISYIVFAAIALPSDKPETIRRYMIIAALVLLTLVVLSEIIRTHSAKRRRDEDLWRDFEETAIERGLTGKELGLCKDMARSLVPEKPMRLITSKQTFDEGARQNMSKLGSIGTAAEELESASDALGEIRRKLGLTFVPFGRRVNSTRGLQPDQKVTIELGKGAAGSRFLATVLDVTDLGIVISPPESAAGQVSLEEGQKVTVALWRADDARYMFTTRVRRPPLGPAKLAVMLEHADELRRTQARTFYRVRVSIPATVAMLVSKDVEELDNVSEIGSLPSRAEFIATLGSLSGGGVSIVSKSRVNVDDLLRVEIDLVRAYQEIQAPPRAGAGETEKVEAVCKVVSVSALPGPRYLVRGSFVRVNETDRDRIVRFVNVKEQKLATEDLEQQE
jgi:hypothetical protein